MGTKTRLLEIGLDLFNGLGGPAYPILIDLSILISIAHREGLGCLTGGSN